VAGVQRWPWDHGAGHILSTGPEECCTVRGLGAIVDDELPLRREGWTINQERVYRF
jgi:hypothetical protein